MKKILCFIAAMTVCVLAAENCYKKGAQMPPDACANTGYVCRLGFESSGNVVFYLSSSTSCAAANLLHSTAFTTYFGSDENPYEVDPSKSQDTLRLSLVAGEDGFDALGVSMMSTYIKEAFYDRSLVSVIYHMLPGSNGNINSIRVLSVSR